jgi:hypothetical protein
MCNCNTKISTFAGMYLAISLRISSDRKRRPGAMRDRVGAQPAEGALRLGRPAAPLAPAHATAILIDHKTCVLNRSIFVARPAMDRPTQMEITRP